MISTWKISGTLYVVAVILNYPWELAQAGLFTAASHRGDILLHCFVAALGDGLMILLLFAVGWLVLRRSDWFIRPHVRGYGILLIGGAALGTAVEWIAVHVLQRWSYAAEMPMLPFLSIGLVPVLQMVLLPPLIFQATAFLVMRRTGGR
jgi:hypothetical protein